MPNLEYSALVARQRGRDRGGRRGDQRLHDSPADPSTSVRRRGQFGDGKYHGRWGFEAFINARGVMYHNTRIDPGVRYTPYAQHTYERKIEDKLMP